MILALLLSLSQGQVMNFYNEGVLLGPAVRFDCVGPAVVCDLPSTYRVRITVDVTVATINATGTPSAATYLRGDGTWATPAGGASPLTTKGDIYTFTTVDARKAVGTDGLCLKANSAEATGLEWAACSAGGGISYAEAAAAVMGGF